MILSWNISKELELFSKRPIPAEKPSKSPLKLDSIANDSTRLYPSFHLSPLPHPPLITSISTTYIISKVDW